MCANEFIHGTVGVSMTQAEFEAVGLHVCNSQATGDVIYASSATQLSRLAVGATDTILSVQGGIPSWRTPANILTDLTGQAGAAFSWNSQNLTSVGTIGAVSLSTSAAIPLLLTNGQLVNISLTSQTVGATTLTIPDFASVVDEFVFKTKAVTMSNKTFVAPALGAATATSINGLIITTTAGTLTIANNASAALVTSGNYSITLTATAATSVTLPTTGTLATLAGAETITAKVSYNGLIVTPNTGAITTGSWTATVISPVYGGTGIANNVASTITITGAYSLGFTVSAATALTLPTTGTLATLAGTEELDSKTLDSSVGKGTWTASGTWTIPAVTLGGTVTLNAQAFDAGSGEATINTTGGNTLKLASTNDTAYGVGIVASHYSASPAVNDILLRLRVSGYDLDTPQNAVNYALLDFLVEDATAASADGKLSISLLSAQVLNEALTLSSVGVLAVDLGGTGSAAQVDLFDQYDDALVLRQGIQQNNRALLADMGVLTRKDTGSGYMMNLQPMVRLLAGGIYQTRQMLEDTRDELLERLSLAEKKLSLIGG